MENSAELFDPKEMQAILQLSAPIRKIRIPSDNCDDQGVLMYNLDTARSKTRLSYPILISSLKV